MLLPALFPPSSVGAASVARDSGVALEQRPLFINNLAPGKRITVRVAVQNSGTATWYRDGAQRTGLNTVDPLNRASALASPSWLASWRPVRMQEARVKPGQVAHFVFSVTAPKRKGLYLQSFQVGHAVANLVPGTAFRLAVASGVRSSYADLLKGRPLDPLPTAADTARSFTVTYKNTGRWAWLPDGITAVRLSAQDATGLATSTWVDAQTPARLAAPVKPGATVSFTVPITRPVIPGEYHPTFRLLAGSRAVSGTDVTVNIAVDGTTPSTTEPTLRVGLFTTATPVTITTSATVTVTDGAGNALGTLPSGATLTDTFDFTALTHAATFGDTAVTANGTLRLVAANAETVQTITSYAHPPAFDSALNDNTFRGTLEIHFAPATGKLWVINELPLDAYLKGLAEVTNAQPMEYLKTLETAARSYAFWHFLANTKHANEGFTLNATTDQVYRGEGFERRAPNPVMAVEATRGVVLLHPGAVSDKNPFGVALGAYSSCTDGRTRSFSERWGGDQSLWPWLVSVPDPNGICTNSTYLAGGGGNHMVGLSAVGARYDAATLNEAFDQILKYYYTGVTVAKIY